MEDPHAMQNPLPYEYRPCISPVLQITTPCCSTSTHTPVLDQVVA